MAVASPPAELQTAPAATSWYAMTVDDVAAQLKVDPSAGLAAAEITPRQQKYGPNALPTEKPPSGVRRFLNEYKSYLQIILVVAGVASMAIGEFSTALLLLVLTVVNAIIGMVEEGKAQSAMNSLKSMITEKVKVRRDGAPVEIDPTELVPGDIVILSAGDRVPADGRVITANSLQIDESALTGESTPASKQVGVPGQDLAVADQVDMAFENTDVTHGNGHMLVTGTGSDTQVGDVAKLLKSTGETETPLTRQLNNMTLWIALAALVTMIVMFVVGLARGQAFDDLFVTAVALAIAAVPEALPTVVTVILSLGSVSLAQRHAVVKSLSSVETLGEVSAINSDKTGTLTMNQMTVTELVEGGDSFQVTGQGISDDGQILRVAGKDAGVDHLVLPFVVSNDATIRDGKVVGDPLEGAFIILAHKAGMHAGATKDKFPRVAVLPFDPTYKLSATFNKANADDGRPLIRAFVKGAAPAILQRSATLSLDGAQAPLDGDSRRQAEDTMARMEGEGLRVLAAATKDIDPKDFDPAGDLLALMADLELWSIVGLIDPPRPSSKPAVEQAQAAHIRVRMVTGDDATTGAAVASQLGIPGRAILGSDLSAMSDEEALAQIDDIGVIGRVAPADKARLVQILQKKGDVLAATGDGVNDAAALKAADIGVAMGSGTDVAKSSGRMILDDDNFATIIFAVEQGRKLYDNLTKYVRFILITLVAFVLTFLFATLLNIAAGQPFSAVQILWINFLIDTPLGVALGFDQETPGLMSRKPLPRGSSIITRDVIVTATGVGIVMTAGLLGLIKVGQTHYGSSTVGSTLALTAFAFFRIVGVWESRSVDETALTLDTFANRQLNKLIIAVLLLSVLVTQLDFLKRWIGLTSLTFVQWAMCLGCGFVLFVLWELGKLVARARARGRRPAAAAPAAPAAPAPRVPVAD